MRISISNPHNTLNQNLISFSNIIEISRLKKLKNLYMHPQAQFMEILKFAHFLKKIIKTFLFQFMVPLNYQMKLLQKHILKILKLNVLV